MRFADRAAAGRALARRLERIGDRSPVVVGLPRGGVVVAAEVARHLGAPLDVIVVRKLGVPWQQELAAGAIGEDGVSVLDAEVLRQTGLDAQEMAALERVQRHELLQRVERYRGGRAMMPLTGRTALIVDDGIATGSTARAACKVARAHGAREIVLAAPIGPPGIQRALADVADEVVVLQTPHGFAAVGECYDDFRQTSDDEVLLLLSQ